MAETLKNPPGYEIDFDLLRTFERGLDPRKPELSEIPAKVLGYGEISTVFAIERPEMQGLAFKRLPIFETWDELESYTGIYERYNDLLAEAGLCVASHGYATFSSENGRPLLYIVQRKEEPAAIGHRAIHTVTPEEVAQLFRHLLGEVLKVWKFNARQNGVRVGVDGQISNWSIQGFDPDNPRVDGANSLVYLDTSTPLFRIEGREQLNPELFLRSAPSFLRWVLRWLFLDDVLNRYYDFRLVVIDALANFYKEQRPDLVPAMLDVANAFLNREAAELGAESISDKEVRDYYREDALIWSVYLSMRRLDRTLHSLLGREYPYILPGKIRR